MKLLRAGQDPHNDGDYPVTKIGFNECTLADTLYGFDSNYRSPVLDLVDSGIVYTEYILPQQVKKQYPNLELIFDAALMIENNHFEKCRLHIKDPPPKTWTNFVSTFNKSYANTKRNFLLVLYANGWFNPEYCSKFFEIDINDAENYFHQLSKNPPAGLLNFCQGIWKFDTTSKIDVIFDLDMLSSKIQQSFIHVVTETMGESSVPFPTEKLLFPIMNKTIWIAYTPMGYHRHVEEHMGFKRYKGIDYSFDFISDSSERLMAIEQILSKLSQMSCQEQQEFYDLNQNIIEYNYQLISSGKFIENLKNFDQVPEIVKSRRERLSKKHIHSNNHK